MSKDARDVLLLWLTIFGISVLYRYTQSVVHHDALTWHSIGNSMLQGAPLAIVSLTVPRIFKCGWKEPQARAASLRLIALQALCQMVAMCILVVNFLFERQSNLLPSGIILASLTAIFVGCHLWAGRILSRKESVSVSSEMRVGIPGVRIAEETISTTSYESSDQPLRQTIGR
jgi:hypothetical protein